MVSQRDIAYDGNDGHKNVRIIYEIARCAV